MKKVLLMVFPCIVGLVTLLPHFESQPVSFDNEVAVYVNGVKQNELPKKEEGYKLDVKKSSCTNGANLIWDQENWSFHIANLTETKTRCSFYFIPEKYYLFSPTDTYETVTGGWEFAISSSKTTGMGTYNHTEDYKSGGIHVYQYITAVSPNGQQGVEVYANYQTINEIDFSDYNTLYFYASVPEMNGWAYYYQVGVGDRNILLSQNTEKKLYQIDISGLTEKTKIYIKYRVCAYYYGARQSALDATIYEMWLE